MPALEDGPTAALVAGAALVVHDFASGARTVSDTLAEIARLALEATGGDAAGVTWVSGRRLSTVASTEALALELDNAQYDAERGPCIAAVTGGTVTRVDDTIADATWPEFAEAAATRGIRSTVSFPIAAGRVFGALNIYGRGALRFEDDESVAPFAAQAAVAGALDAARLYADQLTAAIESRAVIDQAKGIIMAAAGCDADAAFDVLVRQSQHENRKVREIAAEIVARQRQRPNQPGG